MGIRNILLRREAWLTSQGLPLSTQMDNGQRQAYLKVVKAEYFAEEYQRRLIAEEKRLGKQPNYRSRWCREMQRRCGTKPFWELVSFAGRFDAEMFEKALGNGGVFQPAADSKQ